MLLDTPICDFGWRAPDFTLKDTYGQSYTMRDHLDDKGLLIAFICNHCPYVQRIGERLAADTRLLMAEGIDARMGDAKDRKPELLNAMRLIAETGKGPKSQTPSMGCSIKWRE